MLTDRITLASTLTEPEDYLSTSLGVIFPDDINNQHGDASCPVTYSSPRYGELFLRLADPRGEGTRRLFSHHLWNAGVQLAALIEEGDEPGIKNGAGGEASRGGLGDGISWSVRGDRVLELGAGTGLAGIVAAKAGADEVVISDYPAEEVLANLRMNVRRNLEVGGRDDGNGNQEWALDAQQKSRCSVIGHEWGCVPEGLGEEVEEQSLEGAREDEIKEGNWGSSEPATASTDNHSVIPEETAMSSSNADATQASSTLLPSTPQTRQHFVLTNAHTFTRILVADCLWMPAQHYNLQRSISWFLAPRGRAWVVAGFHTGRAKMAGFFDHAALQSVGLEVERIWERDAMGEEVEWVVDRGVEDPTSRKRWLVIAVLKRVESTDPEGKGEGRS